jgi:hypothetical protein
LFFNWSGVVFHGALMKGEAIHQIAAECIIRYFFKCIGEEGIERLDNRLYDAFRDNPLTLNQEGDGSPLTKWTNFKSQIINL